MKRLIYILSTGLFLTGLVSAQTNQLRDAEEHLRNRAYKDAETLLAKTTVKESDDYIRHLRALAAFYQADYETAIKHADVVIALKDSNWSRKALFLKAQSLVEQKKHEAANAIYEAEAKRLFELPRKEAIVGRLLALADELATEPEEDDLSSPPPNFAQALALYRQIVAADIGPEMKDEVQFKAARMMHKLRQFPQAESAFQVYLQSHDPAWLGVVGSPERLRGEARINPPKAGAHILEARFHLVECQLALSGQSVQIVKGQRHQKETPNGQPDTVLPRLQMARQNAEDLIVLLEADAAAAAELLADTRWLAVRSYNLPLPSSVEREIGIAAVEAFMKAHPRHPRATDSGMLIARTWQQAGRAEEAIAAYLNFAAGRGFTFVAEDEWRRRPDLSHRRLPVRKPTTAGKRKPPIRSA